MSDFIQVNPTTKRQRLEAFLADSMLVTLAYTFISVVGLMINFILSFFTKFTPSTKQVLIWSIAWAGLPVFLLMVFTWNKFNNSPGKSLLGLKLSVKNQTCAILRIFLKLIPYHFIFMAFVNFFARASFKLTFLLLALGLLYWFSLGVMIVKRDDQRHWIDLISNSQVQKLGDD